MHDLLLYKTLLVRSLIDLLREEGITVTTGTAIDIKKIIARKTAEELNDLSSLKFTISPLLSRNKEDQESVYKIFDGLQGRIKPDIVLPPVTDTQRIIIQPGIPRKKYTTATKLWLQQYWWVLAIIASVPVAFLLLLAATENVWRETRPRPYARFEISTPREIVANDSAQFIATYDRRYSRKEYSVDWHFQHTTLKNSDALTRAMTVTAYLVNAAGKFVDSTKATFDVLCERRPYLSIQQMPMDADSPGRTGREKHFLPVIANGDTTDKRYQYHWYIDDLPVTNNRELITSRPFGKLRLMVNTSNVHCSVDSLEASLQATPTYQLAITGTDNLVIRRQLAYANILWCMLLLVAAPAITYIFYRMYSAQSRIVPHDETPAGTDGPYAIPFRDQQAAIHTEASVRRLADVLRKRQVSNNFLLNIRKTIRATVKAGGIPTLEYANTSKPVEFLVFIDKEQKESHLVKLFEHLVTSLQKDQVHLQVYEYDKEPLLLSNQQLHQEKIPLQKLAALYPDSILFIFGDARYFFFPMKGTMKSWVQQKLHQWPVKFIITPFVAADWDAKEKSLIEQNFVVLPADLTSLPVIDKIISQQIDIAAQRKEHLVSPYRSRDYNFQDFSMLQQYLGKGPLLQWVCSLAVYPDIDWNVTLAMGKAIEENYRQRGEKIELVNYTNLLQLSRIAWLQDGVLNEGLRIAMLQYLDKPAQALARKTLTTLLNEIDDRVTPQSIIKERFDIHQKVNQYLVNAYENKTIRASDELFVQQVISNNRLDEGQSIFLENNDHSLLSVPTGIGKKKHLGISAFLKARNKQQRLMRNAFSVTVFILVVLCIIPILDHHPEWLQWRRPVPTTQTFIIQTRGALADTTLQVAFSYPREEENYPDPDYRAGVGEQSNRFSYTIGTTNDRDTIIVPDASIARTNQVAEMELYTADRDFIRRDSFPLNATRYEVNISESSAFNMNILYRDSASLTLANRIAGSLVSVFAVNLQQRELNDTAATVIYHTASAAGELSIVQAAISRVTGTTPVIRQVDSSALPAANAAIVVYVNTGVLTNGRKCTAVQLPASVNEIWQGGTSNRLLSVNTIRNVMYYSVNNTSTFGSYTIDEICLTGSGTYKVITRTTQGYKLFFIRNVSANSLELSVCQDFVPTKSELDNKDESYCDRFNKMTWYYPVDRNRIYLPVSGSNLTRTEAGKLSAKMDSINRFSSQAEVLITQYRNYLPVPTASSVARMLDNQKFNPLSRPKTSVLPVTASHPFQRSYVTISLSRSVARNITPDDTAKRNEVPPVTIRTQRCDTVHSYIGMGKGNILFRGRRYVSVPLKKYRMEFSLVEKTSGYGRFTLAYATCDEQTLSIKTGERRNLTLCDGTRLTFTLLDWQNKTGDRNNKEAIFDMIICPPLAANPSQSARQTAE